MIIVDARFNKIILKKSLNYTNGLGRSYSTCSNQQKELSFSKTNAALADGLCLDIRQRSQLVLWVVFC